MDFIPSPLPLSSPFLSASVFTGNVAFSHPWKSDWLCLCKRCVEAAEETQLKYCIFTLRKEIGAQKRVVSGVVEAHVLFMSATAIRTLISPSLGENPCPVAGWCRKRWFKTSPRIRQPQSRGTGCPRGAPPLFSNRSRLRRGFQNLPNTLNSDLSLAAAPAANWDAAKKGAVGFSIRICPWNPFYTYPLITGAPHRGNPLQSETGPFITPRWGGITNSALSCGNVKPIRHLAEKINCGSFRSHVSPLCWGYLGLTLIRRAYIITSSRRFRFKVLCK